MIEGDQMPVENAGGRPVNSAGMGPSGPSGSNPSSLMRRIAEEGDDPRFQELAAAVLTPGTKIMSAGPGVVTMATRLRQGAPHSYLPLLASWTAPARRVFMVFEREDVEHGVLAELLPGDVVALKHVKVLPCGSLQQPPASSVLDLEARRPFVVVNELPCGPAGPEVEADRIWMTWFHSIANPVRTGAGTIMEEQRRIWFHWLLNDLAVLAIAFSGAVTSQAGRFGPDLRIKPSEAVT